MKEWIKVVTDPMGLAGFALFLVFTVLAKKGKKPAWLPIGAFAMACAALAGGLVLAYFRVHTNPPTTTAPSAVSQPSPTSSTVNQQAIGEIKQESSGTGAVNAAGVQGSPITVNNNTAGATPTPQEGKSKKGKK